MNIQEALTQADLLSNQKKYAEALPLYEALRNEIPSMPQLHNNLGVAYYHTGNMEAACQSYQTAMLIAPYMALPYCNMGMAFNKMERHGEALAYLTFSLNLEQTEVAALNLADTYTKLSNFPMAEGVLKHALNKNPLSAQLLVNMGTVQWGLNNAVAALDYFDRALTQRADIPIARKNIGLINLRAGSYTQGWAGYEHRFAADGLTKGYAPEKEWDGTPGALCVMTEQGVGDRILHASMLADLIAANPNFIWQTDERLIPLLQRSFPKVTFTAQGAPPEDQYDWFIYAGSLGQHFRAVVGQTPGTPYLKADEGKANSFRARLPAGKVVGVSWASIGTQFSLSKFAPLNEWKSVFGVPGVSFVDLQYMATERDREGAPLIHLDDVDAYNDLDTLASLIMACDIVITISNTTAHLAAALGKETWVLVPDGYGKFWYWGQAGTTPWYGSAKIFRQAQGEAWSAVLGRVGQELERRYLGGVQLPLSGLGQLTTHQPSFS